MNIVAYARKLLVAVVGLVAVACFISTTTRPVAVQKGGPPAQLVKTPVKAHLTDGSVVVFRSGVTVRSGTVTGIGQRFAVTRQFARSERSVSLDSILGFEVYEQQVNPGRTLVYGILGTAATAVAIVGGSIAIFGSCPTIYADSAGVATLQAESFSQSIAPILASRDVDRLTATAGSDGIVRLSVRNEALETHHLDQLQLVEVRHTPNELALPAPVGGPIGVSDVASVATVRDAAGQNLAAALERADERFFSTSSVVLDRAIGGGPTRDHLLISVAKPAGRDSLALVLRARSSLLATSALYDYMLGRPGAHALDWLGNDLSQIAVAVQLAAWHAENFGLRIEVQDRDRWVPVANMTGFGPVAWKDIGVVVPALGNDSVHVRVSFTADAFQIDRLAIGWGVRRLEQRAIPIARAVDSRGAIRDDMSERLTRADDRDLETHPGDHFSIEFDVGTAPADTRTFMLASHGYYTEWVRGRWVMAATDSIAFSPPRTDMRDMLQTWKASKDTLETQFFQRRVPIS